MISNMAYTVDQLAEILSKLLIENQQPIADSSSPVSVSTPDPVSEKIKKETDTRVAQRMAIIQKKVEEIAIINATFQVILEDHLGFATAELIVNLLDKCRTRSDMKFNQFCSAYSLPGIKDDLKKRNLILVASALYRMKVKDSDSECQAQYRSIVKFASSCDHCGSVAKQLIERLDIQGIKF